MSLREELGCCVNSFFNNTEVNEGSTPEALSYDLWSRCNVQPVTEECRSTIQLPQIEVDPTCDAPVFLEGSIES